MMRLLFTVTLFCAVDQKKTLILERIEILTLNQEDILILKQTAHQTQ